MTQAVARCIVLAGALVLSLGANGAPAATKPNVVLIVTDDQGFAELGVTGNPIIHIAARHEPKQRKAGPRRLPFERSAIASWEMSLPCACNRRSSSMIVCLFQGVGA